MFYHPSHSHGLTHPTLIDLLGSFLARPAVGEPPGAGSLCSSHLPSGCLLYIFSTLLLENFLPKWPNGSCLISIMSVLREAFTSLSLLYPLIFLCDSYAFLTLVLIGASPLEGNFVDEGLVGLCSLWCTWCQESEWPVGGARSYVSTEWMTSISPGIVRSGQTLPLLIWALLIGVCAK